MQKIINNIIVTALFSILIHNCCYTPEPLDENGVILETYKSCAENIEIINPKNGDTVNLCKNDISGRVGCLDTNCTVRVFVRPRITGLWYIQPKGSITNSNWYTQICIGQPNETGYVFDIIAVAIKKSDSEMIDKFQIQVPFILEGYIPTPITVIRR